MRVVIPFILFLFVIMSQTYAEITYTTYSKLVYPGYSPEDKNISLTIYYRDGTTETIIIPPVIPHNKTICYLWGTWKLSFEITNTNPYTVFVAIPDVVWCYNQTLPYSEDFQKVYVSGVVATYTNDTMVTLNGENGIWVPPYTTVKVQRRGIFFQEINVSIVADSHKVIGPALVDMVWVFDGDLLETYVRKHGVKISNYRLLVKGVIIKRSDNTQTLSMVIPAPLVLKDYDSFRKLLGRYDVDIWVDSYREYILKHRMLSLKNSKRYNKVETPVFYIQPDDTLLPTIDDILAPVRIHDVSKPFDVPAMVLTTDDGDLESIEFSYVMYKY